MPKGRLPTGVGGAGAFLEKKRPDRLSALIEHCTAAKTIADEQGEKFLSYMLAMTIQAAQALAHR